MTTFTFLVTTDNHMGFKEDDHRRRKDSYMAFEEALKIGRDRDVDFILLGGDLFHMNKPSANIEHKCIKIIRRHMSEKVSRKTSFRIVQGKFSHFHKVSHANFEDPNLSVPHPIMTIHGNHDDPTGPNAQSVCEKLATCGLLNYFGGNILTADKSIHVEPIVFEKGAIKIALYGMGFIPDYKLKIAFDKGDVSFMEPPKDTYNILVVHQNRVPFEKNKCIPDNLFPKFFHLIIRGHEHSTESPTILTESKVNGIVYQPGSTVATSISIMEAAPKKVGLFSISIDDPEGDQASLYKTDYELVELKRCRRMIFKDITQKEIAKNIKERTGTNRITAAEFQLHSKEFVIDCIRELLKKDRQSQADSTSSDGDDPNWVDHFELPLVRVRIEYISKSERFDELEVNSTFFPNQVANKDIVLFKKQKLKETGSGEIESLTFSTENDDDDEQEGFECINLGEERRDTIDVMIEGYFKDKPADMQLQALSLSEYTNAVRGASEDGNVISKVLNKKKLQVLNRYKEAIRNETVAETKFHDEKLVHQWFLDAFGNKSNTSNVGSEGDVFDDDIEVIEVIDCD